MKDEKRTKVPATQLAMLVGAAKLYCRMGVEARAAAETLAAGDWTPELSERSVQQLEELWLYVYQHAGQPSLRAEAHQCLATMEPQAARSTGAQAVVAAQLDRVRSQAEAEALQSNWRWDPDEQAWRPPHSHEWMVRADNALAGTYQIENNGKVLRRGVPSLQAAIVRAVQHAMVRGPQE